MEKLLEQACWNSYNATIMENFDGEIIPSP